MLRFVIVTAIGIMAMSTAFADLVKVSNQSEFIQLVQGKTLSRPLIKLEVTSDGLIEGRAVRWDVTGQWTWREGYFCRDLNWGGDDLGYNCQEVRAKDGRIRFTSDRGTGDSAEFRLN